MNIIDNWKEDGTLEQLKWCQRILRHTSAGEVEIDGTGHKPMFCIVKNGMITYRFRDIDRLVHFSEGLMEARRGLRQKRNLRNAYANQTFNRPNLL